jgi:hypothetical protein
VPDPILSTDGEQLLEEYGRRHKEGIRKVAIVLATARNQEMVLTSHLIEAHDIIEENNDDDLRGGKGEYVSLIGGILVGLFVESFFDQISLILKGQPIESISFLLFVICGFIGAILISYSVFRLKK